MALGVACNLRTATALEDPILVGFESELIESHGTDVLITDAEADLVFRHVGSFGRCAVCPKFYLGV